MGTPPIPCTFTPHQIAHNEKRYGEIPPARGRGRGVSPRRFSLLTPSLGVRGRCEVLGLCSRLGRVRPTAWHHSPTSAPSQRVRFHFHAALLLDARRLWIVGCGSHFCMRCRTFGVVMVCIMSSSHSMCIITAGGSRVTICGRVLGARVGSGAGPVPRPGATGL